MNPRFPCAIFLAIFLFNSPGFLRGQSQDSSAQTDQDKSGAMSYLLRTLKFTGSIRERWEATDGPFSVTPSDSYLLSQERLGVGFQPSSWLHFLVEAQDARAFFYQATPSNQLANPFDLHQAWVSLGHTEGSGAFIRIGRQDMVIGSGHLLAATAVWWPNTARNFDVAHGGFATKVFKSELVAGSAILVDPSAVDEHKPGDHIYADYNTFPRLIPGATVEPYLIARTSDNVKSKEGQIGNMDTLALGGRIVGKLPARVDYNFEPLHEFGSYSNDRLHAAALLTGPAGPSRLQAGNRA